LREEQVREVGEGKRDQQRAERDGTEDCEVELADGASVPALRFQSSDATARKRRQPDGDQRQVMSGSLAPFSSWT